MSSVTTDVAMIALDVPEWLIKYSESLDWNNPQVVSNARAIVSKYLANLPRKVQDYSAKEYMGRTPSDIVESISQVDWSEVSEWQQVGFKMLLG